MGEGAWWAAVHGVAKSGTRLSDFTLTFHFHALEKEMATHSSVLAWRNINNLRYPDDTTLMAETEKLKSLLMKVKEDSEKVVKAQHSENEDHGILSHHLMANRWGNSGNTDRFDLFICFLGFPNQCRW